MQQTVQVALNKRGFHLGQAFAVPVFPKGRGLLIGRTRRADRFHLDLRRGEVELQFLLRRGGPGADGQATGRGECECAKHLAGHGGAPSLGGWRGLLNVGVGYGEGLKALIVLAQHDGHAGFAL